jgi:hypothetical protein
MEQPKTSLKRAGPWAVIALVVAAVAGGTLYALRWSPETAAPAPAARMEPEPSASLTIGREEPPAEAGPPALEEVSAHPLYRRAIEGDYLRRWAVVIDNLAEGVSPRRQLGFLAPSLPFTVAERGRTKVIDPASYRRYDAFADAVASVDARVLARAYRALRGPLEAAHRALGYPGASIDRVVARALDRLEGVPIVEGDVEVEEDGAVFAFRQRRLEGLSDVEKHVLRMGPRNTRLLQAKAREVREAIGLPAVRRAKAP